MLGRGFILLALSAPSLFTTTSAKPTPLPGNVDSFDKAIGSPDSKRSLNFNVDLLGINLGVSLGGSRVIDFDQARASYKMKLFSTDSSSDEEKRATEDMQVTNAGVLYTASVGIGSPATQYTLVIDTGSANTWIGAGQTYQQTSTSVSTGENVTVGYGSGGFSGVEYYDQVSLSDDLTVSNFSIGVANTSSGFDSYDGILGLAPANLTSGTVTNTDEIPTLPDALASAGKIDSEIVGVSFAPTTSSGNSNGVMTFGGPGDGQYTGDITYADITSTSPSSKFWGIDIGVTYGDSNSTILSSGSGIVDTGTTLVLLAEQAYDAYVNATGAVLDADVGLLAIDESNYSNLQSLYFTISGTTFELTPNAQTWPRALNSFVNGNDSATYLVVGSSGSQEGNGLDFFLGYTFLERFYSVYDSVNKRVGFASTSNTYSTIN